MATIRCLLALENTLVAVMVIFKFKHVFTEDDALVTYNKLLITIIDNTNRLIYPYINYY